MAFTPEDSWPFRLIGPGRETQPFLIFRGGPRWLLIRAQGNQEQPIPRSASTQTVQIAGEAATLVKYQGSGFKLPFKHDGLPLVLSGDGLSDDDIARVAGSLHALTNDELHARLNQEAAKQKLHASFLWPNDLPAGVSLAIPDSTVQLARPAAGPQADSYHVVFKGGDKLIEVGGGSAEPPQIQGTVVERMTLGSLTGLLTSAGQRFLLVVEAAPGSQTLNFPDTFQGGQKQMPLVQQGRVFVAAENIDRAAFDQVVAGLQPVRAEQLVALARGQNVRSIAYRWPTKLPNGFAVDLSSAQAGWDDFVLQGGLPFFELIATGPNGTVTIRGGRESSGQAFLVPEGPDAERSTPTIHGQLASAARTPDGAVVIWQEEGTLYSISSRTLPVDQLVAVGEGLQPVDAGEFFARLQ